MTGEPTSRRALSPERLEELGARHLWLHFSRMGQYRDAPMPIIDHGDGCWLYDHLGKRYLDALSGLFVVQSGHGRQELADAGAQQGGQLGYFPLWGYAHPPAIELAARLAEMSPGDLNRIFFTVSGSESVESAYKLARQYFRLQDQSGRYKVISRMTAYHGTSLGALSITGVPAMRQPFEPLTPGAFHVPNTNRYRPWNGALADDMTDEEFGLFTADQIANAIEMEGPETVAAVFVEPLQNAGGCLTPPPGYFARVREICDRYGVLLVSDEVICAYGRLGTMFGCERYDYVPDIITTAKGLTSGYSPLGAMLASDRLIEPFLAEGASFTHGITFAGHPVSCAVALANLDLFEKEDWLGNVRANEGAFEAMLEGWRADLPLVGDARGDGYFWAIELVKDAATKAKFGRAEIDALVRGFLAPRLYEAGLVCRTDDRGDPVIQFAPPLIAGAEEFAEIDRIIRIVLTEAWARVDG
ncbi:MAG TPA: aspartate aminotransferase family protein [Microthrixaceae bacterium]|nr:aspartate aminotransferase family protein [Microthrixaceae bacterium]